MKKLLLAILFLGLVVPFASYASEADLNEEEIMLEDESSTGSYEGESDEEVVIDNGNEDGSAENDKDE